MAKRRKKPIIPTLKFLDAISGDQIKEIITITKFTLKSTTNPELKELLNKKVKTLEIAFIKKDADEKANAVDPNLNFIGLASYDIRVDNLN